MEAVKNRLTGLWWNARTFVINADTNLISNARHRHLDEAAGWRETNGVVDDCADCTSETVRLAHHNRGIFARSRKCNARIASLTSRFPAVDQILDQRAEIHPLESGTGQFGVGARCF